MSAAAQVINAGLQIGSALLTNRREKKNREAQAEQNRLDREHEIAMYERTKNDSLQNWNRENEYNDPKQQMQRLREAGLNPNLVYGNGAENTAGAIGGGQLHDASQPAPVLGTQSTSMVGQIGNNLFDDYLSTKRITMQNDIARQQIRVQQANEQLIAARTMSEAENIRNRKFRNDLQETVRDALVQEYELNNNLKRSRLETDLTTRSLNKATERRTNEQSMSLALQRSIDLREIARKENLTAAQVITMAQQRLESQARQMLIISQTTTQEDERRRIDAQIKQIQAMTDKINTDTELAGIRTGIQAAGAILSIFK
jgi:hypothetical protein